MTRREFARAALPPCLAFLGAGTLFGCADEARQTGTVVETPEEDKKSMEASAAAYKAMSKGK